MPIEEFKSLAYGTQAVDWQDRVNIDRMRKERGQRTRAKMKEHGITVAFLTGDNQRYATSIPVPSWQAGAPSNGAGSVVFADYPDDTVVFGMGEVMAQYKIHVPWIKPENLRYSHLIFGHAGRDAALRNAKKQARQIRDAIEQKGLAKEQIAIGAVVPALAAALVDEGLKLTPVDPFMIDARKIKTADEINCMKMGAAICDRAWWALYEHLRPGLTESELASYIMAEAVKTFNLSHFSVGLRSGPNVSPNFSGHSPTDRIIRAGDLVCCDLMGPIYNGYWVCYYRSFKVGKKPTAQEKDWYKQARDWLYASMEAVKPGVTTADIARHFPTCDQWGSKDEAERQTLQIGHGMGLSLHEYPHIHRNESLDFPQLIETGNVFALETNSGEDFKGACRIENVVVVTETGCENIYRWPDEEIIVPGHSLLL